MAATFDCPKCGAPMDFEPAPGDTTVECAFCHETVIIPAEIRVPPPSLVVERYSSRPRSNGRNPLIVAVAVIIILVLGIALVSMLQPSDQTGVDLPTVIYGADAVDATATVDAEAVADARATVDALQPLVTLEQNWPASLTETFADNSHQWYTGDVRDSYITGNLSISSGVYTWNVATNQSCSYFSFPDTPVQTDFYASVDMKLVKMPDDPDADAGMVFRHNATDQSWYYFSLNDKGQYYLGWYNGTEWSTLIPETESAAALLGQTNRLAVGGQGSQFIFMINGQLVDHFVDDNLASGNVGVGINLAKTDEKGIVEFSNFTVLSPTPTP